MGPKPVQQPIQPSSLSPDSMKKYIAQDARTKGEDTALIIAKDLAVARVRNGQVLNVGASFVEIFDAIRPMLEKLYFERGLTALNASFEIQAASKAVEEVGK